AIHVHYAYALLLHGLLAARGHVGFDRLVVLLDRSRFVRCYGRAAIALFATSAFAGVQVANEAFLEKVFADKGAAVFDHGAKLRPSAAAAFPVWCESDRDHSKIIRSVRLPLAD